MKVYIRYLIHNFLRSFIYVSLFFLCLVLILNTLTEIEFFKNLDVKTYYPIYVSFLNSPSLLFEMFPFIFLISTQFFFIGIFKDNQIQIFKYSGLKNSVILYIISLSSLAIGFLLITLFYSFSSNLKNLYLEIKNKYTTDDKYLAVVTNNGLWIKDTHKGLSNVIHASSIDKGFLVDTFISQFNDRYEIIRHIYSEKININENIWVIHDARIYKNGDVEKEEKLEIFSNFDYEKIQSLFSNLSSLSIMELIELKKNYKSLNYSTTEVDLQIQKVISYPIYLVLMTILSTIIMFNTKKFASNTLKISIGFFFSVIIYYINNFFIVMGKTEKMSILISIWTPLLILLIINLIISYKLNEK